MKQRGWQNRFVTSVLVALVCLVGLAEFLPHTDDGCAVEQHCLACRAHISAVTDLSLGSSFLLGSRDFTYVERPREEAGLEGPLVLLPPGRAPPVTA